MSEKIKVSFIYRPCDALELGKHYYSYEYHFFFSALKRNPRIEVTYVKTGATFDAKSLSGKCDVILLYENRNVCEPDEIIGLQKLTIPVIAQLGDAHASKLFDFREYHEKWKIDAYFNFFTEDYVHQYYPRDYKYKTITGWLESSLFENLLPFSKRISNKILNSGAVASTKIQSRIINRLLHSATDPYKHYKLRTMCNKLPYVDYTSTLQHEYVGDKYPLLLQKYQAVIAAATTTYAPKFFEIPAAGCLTFMEITEKNYGKYLGYKHEETAVFISEQNYEEKLKDYLKKPDDPKWEKIANAGKQYALENFNNDKGIDSLVDLMEELI